MARNTIEDVREKIERINDLDDSDLSFECWGVGTNNYRLVRRNTGETIGRTHEGATNFLTFLNGYKARLRRE